jgi:hypothetical protein
MTSREMRWTLGLTAGGVSASAAIALIQGSGLVSVLWTTIIVSLVVAIVLIAWSPLVERVPRQSTLKRDRIRVSQRQGRKSWQTELHVEAFMIGIGRFWERSRFPRCAVLRITNRSEYLMEELGVRVSRWPPKREPPEQAYVLHVAGKKLPGVPADESKAPAEASIAVLSTPDGCDVGHSGQLKPGDSLLIPLALADRSRRRWLRPVECGVGDLLEYWKDQQSCLQEYRSGFEVVVSASYVRDMLIKTLSSSVTGRIGFGFDRMEPQVFVAERFRQTKSISVTPIIPPGPPPSEPPPPPPPSPPSSVQRRP